MFRSLLKVTCLFLAFAGPAAHAGDDEDSKCGSPCGGSWVYVGTRASGAGTGIVGARLDRDGHLTPIGLVAEVPRPTWLTPHSERPVLYATSDTGNVPSVIYSLAVDRETGGLTVKNTLPSGGIGATYLAFDEDLKGLFVAHFGSGQTSWLSVERNGDLGELLSIQQQYGTGPHPRQAAPHSHGVVVDPTQRYLLANDFGADRIFAYRINTYTDELVPATTPYTSVAPGSGPRHSVFHPSGHFLFAVNELTSEVSSFRWDAWQGVLTPVQTLALDDSSYTGTKSASHLVISRDGRFIYVGNRGTHSMHVFSVNPRSGELEQIQVIPAQGQSPWDFALDPSGKWLVVANNVSNTVVVFKVNRGTGLLEATTETFSTPQPSSITFVRADRD